MSKEFLSTFGILADLPYPCCMLEQEVADRLIEAKKSLIPWPLRPAQARTIRHATRVLRLFKRQYALDEREQALTARVGPWLAQDAPQRARTVPTDPWADKTL